jgi:phenylalanyl-tRNA synthetase beta chain
VFLQRWPLCLWSKHDCISRKQEPSRRIHGRALKINSDARYRFERGIDPAFTPQGVELATQMIMEHAGGEASDVVIADAIPDVARAYKLDAARVQSLVGMEIPESTQRQTLTSLGFKLEVITPSPIDSK